MMRIMCGCVSACVQVHLANMWGQRIDKLSFDKRVDWVDENLELVLDSARNPTGSQGWWRKAEKPWQVLATCVEIEAALRCDSGPSQYRCALPIHMDGTCNGLQHYAALGRDVNGAAAVNLLDCGAPNDVYVEVANKVRLMLLVCMLMSRFLAL